MTTYLVRFCGLRSVVSAIIFRRQTALLRRRLGKAVNKTMKQVCPGTRGEVPTGPHASPL